MDAGAPSLRVQVQKIIERVVGEHGGVTEFAKKFGVDRTVVSNWRAGRHVPEKDILPRVSGAFPDGFSQLVEHATKEPAVVSNRPRRKPPGGQGVSDFEPAVLDPSSRHRGCTWQKHDAKKLLEDAAGLLLTDLHRAQKKFEEAAALGKAERSRCPRCYSLILRNLSVIAYRERSTGGLVRLKEAIAEIAPSHPDTAVAYAEMLAIELSGREGSLHHAAEVTRTALAGVGLKSNILWRRLGIIHWLQGYPHEAWFLLSKSVGPGVDKQMIAYHMGHVLIELDRMNDAVREFTRIIGHSASGHLGLAARCGRAFAWSRTGEHVAASKDFARAAAEDPSSFWLHYFQGRDHQLNKRMPEAISSYNYALLDGRRGVPTSKVADVKTRLEALSAPNSHSSAG